MFLKTENGLSFSVNGKAVLSELKVGLTYWGKFFNRLTVPAKGAWHILEAYADGGVIACENFEIQWKQENNGVLVRTRFTNTDDVAYTRCIELQVLGGRWHNGITRCCTSELETFHSFPQAAPVCTMGTDALTVPLMQGQVVEGGDVMALTDAEESSLIWGFASYERYFNRLTVDHEGLLYAGMNVESRTIEPGQSVYSDWLFVGTCDTAVDGLAALGKTLKRLMKVGEMKEIPTGWCTWYYYMDKMNADDVRENMNFLARRKEQLPIRYIQIDDGWFEQWGDWEDADKFGAKMQDLAAEIQAAGYIPGIWLCPFVANVKSRTAREHPDWMVKKDDGTPAGDWYNTLDTTNPEVHDYLVRLFEKLSKEWGFRYIKMDFVAGAMMPGKRYDPEASTLMALREGYKTFLEGVTEDTFMLGCSSPMLPAAGLVDGMRISCDIFEDWTAVQEVFRRVLKRFFYHKNAFINDADCLIVRKPENQDEKCWRYCTRDDAELKTFVTAMAASGGIFMLSDKMPLLSEEQRGWIGKLFPINQEAALPLDLMDARIPGVLDFGVRGNTRVVALINWLDVPKTFTVPVENGVHAYEFWTETYEGTCGTVLRRELPPHGCAVYFLTPDAEKVVVGENGSLTPAHTQKLEDGVLTVTNAKPGAEYTVLVQGEVRRIVADGENFTL